jgi:hypothetical protein
MMENNILKVEEEKNMNLKKFNKETILKINIVNKIK